MATVTSSNIYFLFLNDKTIVWTAYRGDPPASSKAKLALTMRGELLLQTGPGQKKVISHGNNGTVSSASMLDSGNFVLQNKNSDILCQTLDHPTDTMLGGQILTSGSELVSSSSDTNQSSGRFQLAVQSDGNLVLYPRYSGSTAGDAYWASDSYGGDSSKYYLFLNNTDPRPLCIVNVSSSNKQILWRSDYCNFKGNNTIYRATIDYDGDFRLYIHYEDINRTNQVKMLWSPPELDNLCKVKTFCGFNSYCTINDNQP
ncbi:hypothetical protein K1719_003040 [Acacia pycnantha]|nr:hypothetical protein K1719_003040 [Acacia pycnantha]